MTTKDTQRHRCSVLVMMDDKTIGVLGGGQLGRMMAAAAHRLGLRLAILDPGLPFL
jgi:phosphoglycerate dehydrogenase-like enzyme